jgi:hypothetical protein
MSVAEVMLLYYGSNKEQKLLRTTSSPILLSIVYLGSVSNNRYDAVIMMELVGLVPCGSLKAFPYTSRVGHMAA